MYNCEKELYVRLNKFRTDNEFSIQELAEYLGFSYNFISGVLNNTKTIGDVSYNKIKKIITGKKVIEIIYSTCLKCNEEFKARGKYNKVCRLCRAKNQLDTSEDYRVGV